jgi:hypothetical protein
MRYEDAWQLDVYKKPKLIEQSDVQLQAGDFT